MLVLNLIKLTCYHCTLRWKVSWFNWVKPALQNFFSHNWFFFWSLSWQQNFVWKEKGKDWLHNLLFNKSRLINIIRDSFASHIALLACFLLKKWYGTVIVCQLAYLDYETFKTNWYSKCLYCLFYCVSLFSGLLIMWNRVLHVYIFVRGTTACLIVLHDINV